MKAKRSSGVFWVDGVQRLGEQLAMAFEFVKARLKAMKPGFVWVRPDGKTVTCRSAAGLVKAIMDHDGRHLRQIVAAASRYGITAN